MSPPPASTPPPFTKEQIAYWKAHEDESLQPNIIASIVICWLFPFIAVALRLVCRRIMRAPLLADDWFIIASLVPLSGTMTSMCLGVATGSGLHIIFASNLTLYMKCKIINQTTSPVATLFTKISIMYFYYRIFHSKSLAKWSYLVGALAAVYAITLPVISLTQCRPLSKFWNPNVEGSCINTAAAYTVLSVLNVVTDVVILALPIRHVWVLQMDTARKLQVCGIFALGGIVCIFSVLRSFAVRKATGQVDVTYESVYASVWSTVEIGVGIVCACLPTYRPLFSKAARHGSRTTRSHSNSYGRSDRSKNRSHGHLSGFGSKAGHIPLRDRDPSHAHWSARITADGDSDTKPFASPSESDQVGQAIPYGQIKVGNSVHVSTQKT